MKFTRLVTGAFALLLLVLLPLRAVAESIAVDPTSWDYGEVAVGDTEYMSSTITSMGPLTPLTVDGISIVYDTTDSFEISSITPEVTFPHALPVGESLEVVVAFAPSAEGSVDAFLYIVSNANNGLEQFILLEGVGVVEPQTPEEMMADLLDFYEEGVDDGMICGIGPGNSANAKLRIFARMLDTADDLIGVPDYAAACDELERAFLRSDDAPRPQDFIDCELAPAVNAMIGEVMDALACE